MKRRMVQHIARAAPAPNRHNKRVGDKLSGHAGTHRPADDAAREQVDDGSNIEPAFGGP